MRNIFDRSNTTTRAALLVGTVLSTLLFAVGCSDVLKVELPGRIPTDLLGDPITAPTLAASVTADFECAYSNYIASTSILSDQFLGASGNLNAKNWGTKKINEDNTPNETRSGAGSLGAYTPLQTARFQSDDILARLQAWSDDQAKVPLAPLRARVAALGAYAYTLLGEGFCAMRFNNEKVIHPPADVLATAEGKFDGAFALVNAMSAGSAKTELLNLVYVGRARVRLDRGNTAGAAADAALVTHGFEFFVTRSVDADTRWNDAWYALSE